MTSEREGSKSFFSKRVQRWLGKNYDDSHWQFAPGIHSMTLRA